MGARGRLSVLYRLMSRCFGWAVHPRRRNRVQVGRTGREFSRQAIGSGHREGER
ncbi:hypothetical protein MGAST_01940 [Mycobacterium gastri 'Wayne']|nr:hypothetical protein MGAST_01940 [Mycobacterium gastri 'Wayne']